MAGRLTSWTRTRRRGRVRRQYLPLINVTPSLVSPVMTPERSRPQRARAAPAAEAKFRRPSPESVGVCRSVHPLGRSSRQLAGVDPALEDANALFVPGPVARHRSSLEAVVDRVAVFADVVVVPEIEGETH